MALGAGFLSFVSPCVLPLVPAYITHLVGSAAGARRRGVGLFHALAFVGGFSLVFVVLGASVGMVGSLAGGSMPLLRRIAGVMLMALGLQMMGILRLPFLHYERRLNFAGGTPPTYVR